METKKEFVEAMGALLKIAKPHLVKCELEVEGYDKYVFVTCENGYQYKIDVTANSAATTVIDVFSKMVNK